MQTIFANLLRLGGMQIVLGLTAIVRNKTLAVRLGVEGYGEFSQIVLLALSASAIAAFGLSLGLSRNVASTDDPDERQRLLSQANSVNILISVLGLCVAVPLIWTRPQMFAALGVDLVSDPAMMVVLMLVLLTVPLDAAVNHRVAFLTAVRDVKGLTSGRSVALLIATAFSVPIVWYFGLVGAAIQALLITAIVFIALNRRCASLGYRPLRFSFSPRTLSALLAFGIASLLVGLSDQFTNLFVRSRLINVLGAVENGYYQAGLAILGQLNSIVLGAVGSYALATLSQDPTRGNVTKVSNDLLAVVLPIAAMAFGTLGLLCEPLVLILYSSDFLPVQKVMPFLVFAEFMQVSIWVLGAPLLAQRRIGTWVLLEFIFYLTRTLASLWLLPRYGIEGVAIGYTIATLVHFLTTAGAFWMLGFAVHNRNLVLLLAGGATTGLLGYAGSLAFDLRVFGAAACLLLAFAVLSMHWTIGASNALTRVRLALAARGGVR